MAEILEYKCPNCGADITFDSHRQTLKCQYCDSEFNVDTLKEYDEILNSQQPESTEWETGPESEWDESDDNTLGVFICNSCGGEIMADKTAVALNCPFCDSPVVLSGRVSGYLKPDKVIPFKLDKAAAKAAFLNHLKGKRLLPKVFKTEAKIEEIKGVYVPFWLFDTGVEADIRYHTTRVSHWHDDDNEYTVTEHYSAIRQGKLAFSDVPVDGSSKMADDLMESLEPFDRSQAVDFRTAYLSGYLADKYDIDAEESKPRANLRIKQSTEDIFRSTVSGYATVYAEHSSLRHFNGKVKYALYPVWMLNTSWDGRKFTFAMNGQTGKFVGDLPLSRSAYWKWLLGVAGLAAAGVFGIAMIVALIGGWL